MMRPKRADRDAEQALIKNYRSLSLEDRRTLRDFGEFLASRGAAEAPEAQGLLDPEPIQRPEAESVVAAIKRLSRCYFMLDRGTMLNDTSSLMSAHVLQGRPTNDVIDELEALFARHYAKYREEHKPDGA